MEHPEKSRLPTQIHMPYQETFNKNMVDNYLISPTAISTPYSDKPNKSYNPWKVADQRRFWQKAGNRFSFEARVRVHSRTELKEQWIRNAAGFIILPIET
jgi:hypothetical protein